MRHDGVVRGLTFPSNSHRVCKCGRVQTGAVQVLKGVEHGTAHYGGLMACGSVWACPVCAAKVGERRREEIAAAFDYAYNRLRGHKVIMVTFTFPHMSWQQLEPMLRQQADALRRLRSGKVWQRIKAQAGYGGLIRSLEITHGRHGWHPHTHEAWIVDADCDAESLRETITARWAASCRRSGLLGPDSEADFMRHAVDVLDHASESSYLAKQDEASHWGADRELSGGSTKRSAGRHPFSLLDDASAGDQEAARLFRDYVRATHGKAQVFWSRGLKAAVGIGEKTDEELAEDYQEAAEVVALIHPRHWRAVLDERARSLILDLAESGGFAALAGWFDERGLPPPDPGPFC